MPENNAPIVIFKDGLVQSNIHGIEQDLFLVTEERVESFNSQSLLLQISIPVATAALGLAVGCLLSFKEGEMFRNVFYFTFATFLSASIISVMAIYKFRKTKKKLFTKAKKMSGGHGFQVKRAIYGTDNNQIDVTQKLKGMVNNNRLSVKATNEIQGDPEKGTIKKLTIDYIVGGVELSSTFTEGEYVNLP